VVAIARSKRSIAQRAGLTESGGGRWTPIDPPRRIRQSAVWLDLSLCRGAYHAWRSARQRMKRLPYALRGSATEDDFLIAADASSVNLCR
jgi:hypothetical protein